LLAVCAASDAECSGRPLVTRTFGALDTTVTTDVFIDGAITVVIDAIADLSGNFATDTTRVEHSIVDDSIAVVVDAIADFGGELAARAAGVQEIFVGFAITIVVDAVADFRGARVLIRVSVVTVWAQTGSPGTITIAVVVNADV
jgi:hypothetical protein